MRPRRPAGTRAAPAPAAAKPQPPTATPGAKLQQPVVENSVAALTTPAGAGKELWMKLENAGELVSLGTEIVKLGAALDEAQKELSAAQQRVLELEGSLRPLLTRHAELIQSAVGMPAFALSQPSGRPSPAPAPAAAPSELSMAPIGSPAALPAAQQLKARVKDFLQTRVKDDAISASEVAEALHIDALIVREAMLELRHGR